MSFALLAIRPDSRGVPDRTDWLFYKPAAEPAAHMPGARVHRCKPCSVTWNGVDATCWSCGLVGAVATPASLLKGPS